MRAAYPNSHAEELLFTWPVIPVHLERMERTTTVSTGMIFQFVDPDTLRLAPPACIGSWFAWV